MGFGLVALGVVVIVVLWLAIKATAEEPGPPPIQLYCAFRLDSKVVYGLVEGDRVRQIDGDLFGPRTPTKKTFPRSEVKFAVPVRPTKILAVLGNYASPSDPHQPRKDPALFLKPPSCLIADGQPIVIPTGAKNVHAEGAMAIVIGKRASKLPADKAKPCVFGVTCGNNVSARDWQKSDGQGWRANGCDTFGPCGPIVAVNINYDDLLLVTRVNGQVRQQQRTKDLIHNVASIVSFASMHVTLEPGDVIYTGTPGKTHEIHPGDVVEVELQGVGTLRNPVQAQAGKDRR